eukprot:PRCOL_00001612-RA
MRPRTLAAAAFGCGALAAAAAGAARDDRVLSNELAFLRDLPKIFRGKWEGPGLHPLNPGTLIDLVRCGPALESVEEFARAKLPWGCSSSIAVVDLDTGDHAFVNATEVFPAASTIKLPVLVALYEAVDRGHVSMAEALELREELLGAHSGGMQYRPLGTEFTVGETAHQMAAVSDNTATNMLIARLGGFETLNQQFKRWGMQDTVLRQKLPDLDGHNTTSARDLAYLLTLVDTGHILGLRSRDRLLLTMTECSNEAMLRSSVRPGAHVANKTGDIGFVVGDAGLVTTVKGRRYVAVGFARRPYNEEAGSRYLRSVFERAHDALDTQHPDAAVAAIEYPVVGTALYDEFVEAMRDRSPDGVRHRKEVVERRMAGRW